jgi:hypothetical protein
VEGASVGSWCWLNSTITAMRKSSMAHECMSSKGSARCYWFYALAHGSISHEGLELDLEWADGWVVRCWIRDGRYLLPPTVSPVH